MKIAFEWEVPDGALDKKAQAELVRSAKAQTVLELNADDLVTTGEAAAMLGLTAFSFWTSCRRAELDSA